MSKDRTQNAADKKNCKHCYSTIHRRASVCSVCNRTVTYRGQLGSFFTTAFPILTAIVSLGFAAYEKYENIIVSNNLAYSETIAEATQAELKELASMRRQSVVPTLERSLAMVRESSDSSGTDEPTAIRSSVPPEQLTENQKLKKVQQKIKELDSSLKSLSQQGVRNNKAEIFKIQKDKSHLEYILNSRNSRNR